MGRRKTEQDKERQRRFGQRVFNLREEQRLKQDDVMLMSGIERSFISNVENGIHSITSVRLQELAEGLRVDVTDLFEPEQGVARKDDVKSHPRYLQLADYMTKEIASGLLRPGDFLKPEPVICKQYGYSRFAVRKALTVLRGLGLIRTWGQNHFVASERDLQPLLLGDGLDKLFPLVPDDQRRTVIDGLELLGDVPGWLQRWERSSQGMWIGVVHYSIRYIDGRSRRYSVTDQLVPHSALRPRDS